MIQMFNTFRIFGGSSSAPRMFVEPKDSFWGLTAMTLKFNNIVNYSWPGCSMDSIWHILVSEQDKFSWADDFFLITIPPLERLTIFDNHKDTKQISYKIIIDNNWSYTTEEISSHHGLMNMPFHRDKSTVIFEDRSWTEVVAMRQIFFLTKWLDSLSAKYLIVNASKPFDDNNIWAPSSFLLPYCKNHPRVKIFSNTYSSVNIDVNWPEDFSTLGWDGHHGAKGNQRFFDLGILPHLKECNLC